MYNLQAHMVVKFFEVLDGVITLTELKELLSSIDRVLINLLAEVYVHFLVAYLKLHNVIIRLNYNVWNFCWIPATQWMFNFQQHILRLEKIIRSKIYLKLRHFKGRLNYSLEHLYLIIKNCQVFFTKKIKYAIRLRNVVSPLILIGSKIPNFIN